VLSPWTTNSAVIYGSDPQFPLGTDESFIAIGSASVDAVHVGVTGEFVVVLHVEAVGVDKEFVDVCLRTTVKPFLVVEGMKWLVDWCDQILWRGPNVDTGTGASIGWVGG
jgi:hypothetical protein